jgi:DNA-directed RNA polymerase subunit K/omega
MPSAAMPPARIDPTPSAAVMCGFGLTSVLSIALFLAGMPLLSMCILAISGMSTIVLESALTARQRRDEDVAAARAPEVIVGVETRDTYRAILAAHGEIRRSFAEAARLHASLSAMLSRCDAVVKQASRLAMLTNPLQRYLDTHDRARTEAELARVQSRSEASPDAEAVDALVRAAAARARQLETHDQIAGMRDRIQARLELVRAALESFSATVIKLRIAGEEQMIVSGESAIEQLDDVGDELELLETELAIDLAA